MERCQRASACIRVLTSRSAAQDQDAPAGEQCRRQHHRSSVHPLPRPQLSNQGARRSGALVAASRVTFVVAPKRRTLESTDPNRHQPLMPPRRRSLRTWPVCSDRCLSAQEGDTNAANTRIRPAALLDGSHRPQRSSCSGGLERPVAGGPPDGVGDHRCAGSPSYLSETSTV